MSSLLWFLHRDNILLPNLARWWNLQLHWLSTLQLCPSSSPLLTPFLNACSWWMPNFNTRGATNRWKSSMHVQRLYTVYSKDDVRSPFVKPPWFSPFFASNEANTCLAHIAIYPSSIWLFFYLMSHSLLENLPSMWVSWDLYYLLSSAAIIQQILPEKIYFTGIVSRKFGIIRKLGSFSPFLFHPFFKISSFSCRIFDYSTFSGEFSLRHKTVNEFC
jgi:hypothetical protein